ncbi:NACHT domain-containing protein [Micromonospora chersina]|uniref:NACHT N-terminal Helical domain 1-containing protein n=1 Tax=Micromonospora chersina TaxID=47854 RepID=UPI00371FEFA5
MAIIEAAATGLAKAVVTQAANQWLLSRRDRRESPLELPELLAVTVRDRFARRKLELQLETLVAEVAERIERCSLGEYGQELAVEAPATLSVVARVIALGAGKDRDILEADADPEKLLSRLIPAFHEAATVAALSERSTSFGEVVLRDCVRCYVELIRNLPHFAGRASQESLARLSRISADLTEVLSRLPLQNPVNNANDDRAFTDSYLRYVSSRHDQLEIFGADVRNYSAETTLSIAYLSLAVSNPRVPSGRNSRQRSLPRQRLSFRRHTKSDDEERYRGIRVEGALATGNRFLIRGEAGSGKSTLLRWIAIMAARRKFTGGLKNWNGRIPFLIKLRSYADMALPRLGPQFGDDLTDLAEEVPENWITRAIEGPGAILLIDGVDELVRSQRAAVRQWLRGILERYPDIIVAITSRPTAAPVRWLSGEGFETLSLEPMSPADVTMFVQRWHRAISGAGHLPCERSELPRYERRVLNRLEDNPHLRGLATNPLMCAMICALNLDRADDLPHDRLSLYRAALEMLLERRDAARSVPSYKRFPLGAQNAMSLLQDLAWRLSISNRSEIDSSQAVAYIGRKMRSMPKLSDVVTDDVFDYLLERSGVLKDVAEDRLSFLHRTFQEYLAAKEIAEENYIDVAIANAARDMWRETIIMAAGLASSEYRHRLINGILDRADEDPRKARWLRLLAGACVETAPALAPQTIERIDQNLKILVPPRTPLEANSLALAGERVVPALPDDISQLSVAAAASVVVTASLVGGSKALNKLANYGSDTRHGVINSLISAAERFDPDEYGRVVLADSPLLDGWVHIESWMTGMLRHLKALRGVRFLDTESFGFLDHLPPLRGLEVTSLPSGRTDFLANHPDLEHLRLYGPVKFSPVLATLLKLREVNLTFADEPGGLEWLRSLKDLSAVRLGHIAVGADAAYLTQLPALKSLVLAFAECKEDLSFVRQLPSLDRLGLNNTCDPDIVSHIAHSQSRLIWLQLMSLHADSIDLKPLASLPLEYLDFDGFRGPGPLDLSDLAFHQTLRTLDIRDCSIGDLAPIASIPHLQNLYLYNVENVDLAPLKARPNVLIFAEQDQALVNAEGLRLYYY